MDNEEIIIPEEKQDADPVAEEVAKIKSALAEAQQLAFSKFVEMKMERENPQEDNVPPVGDAPAVDAPPPKVSALDREIDISREARMLEGSGIPYSIALKIAEANADGDYETVGKLLQAHQNNENLRNADAIAEAQENDMLRRAFGLPNAAPAKRETESDRMKRIFGLR